MSETLFTLTRPLLVFDCETTTKNPETARICSMAFRRYVEIFPGGMNLEWKSLINPCVPIPRESSHGVGGDYHGHGITDAMVQGCKTCGQPEGSELHSEAGPDGSIWHPFAPWPTFQQIAPSMAKGFTGVDFCGKNIRFDLKTTRREFTLSGIKDWDYHEAKIVDVDRIEQLGQPRTLSALYERYFGEKLEGAHDAFTDIQATIRILCAQLDKFDFLPRIVSELDALSFPGRIDSDGKFAFNESGIPVVNFGKWRDVPMARVERSYWHWLLKQDFAPSTKLHARNALQGIFPALSTPVEREDM